MTGGSTRGGIEDIYYGVAQRWIHFASQALNKLIEIDSQIRLKGNSYEWFLLL